MEMNKPKHEFLETAAIPAGPGGPVGPSLQDLQAMGEKFLKAGSDAISRALSKNSEEFLASSRQAGGQ